MRVVGNTKGMVYPPRTEELVEFLGNISWAIISLNGPWHAPHGHFKGLNNMGGLSPEKATAYMKEKQVTTIT